MLRHKEPRKVLQMVKRDYWQCFVRKCSAWHFVKGAAEHFLSPVLPASGGGETNDGPRPRVCQTWWIRMTIDLNSSTLPFNASHFPFSANAKLIKYEERLMERCNSQTKAYIRRRWCLEGRVLLSIEKSCRAEDTTYMEINHSVGFYRSYQRVWGR